MMRFSSSDHISATDQKNTTLSDSKLVLDGSKCTRLGSYLKLHLHTPTRGFILRLLCPSVLKTFNIKCCFTILALCCLSKGSSNPNHLRFVLSSDTQSHKTKSPIASSVVRLSVRIIFISFEEILSLPLV